MMRMIVTTIINISIVLYGTLWPYETGTITFHFTVEETEVQQVKKICPRSQGCYGELGFPPQQCGLLLPLCPAFAYAFTNILRHGTDLRCSSFQKFSTSLKFSGNFNSEWSYVKEIGNFHYHQYFLKLIM